LLEAEFARCLDRFVAGDDPALAVYQNRAAGTQITERVLQHLAPAFTPEVSVALVEKEVGQWQDLNCGVASVRLFKTGLGGGVLHSPPPSGCPVPA